MGDRGGEPLGKSVVGTDPGTGAAFVLPERDRPRFVGVHWWPDATK